MALPIRTSGTVENVAMSVVLTLNNKLAITTADEATVRSQIIAGRNGGAWNGPTGITSSTAAVDPTRRAVGYTASGGSVTVSYALIGDSDLNGAVNGVDANAWRANFGAAGTVAMFEIRPSHHRAGDIVLFAR